MVSFDTALTRRDQPWCVIVTIEGSGNGDGIFKYCSTVPTYAAANANYRPWLMSWPSSVSERIDDISGLPEAGDIEIRLLDYENRLTSEFQIERERATTLTGALSYVNFSLGTTLTMASYAGVAIGDVRWIGGEAVRVDSGSGPFQVSRGYLDTDVFNHQIGTAVFDRLSYLNNRRLRIYVAPLDGDSSSDERQMGSYSIDGIELDPETLGGYVLRAKSQQKWLDRVIPRRRPNKYRIAGYIEGEARLLLNLESSSNTTLAAWPGKYVYARIGNRDGEVITLPQSGSRTIKHRAQLGTTIQEFKVGDPVEIIFGADDAGVTATDATGRLGGFEPTFFRYSAASSTTRSSGWVPSSHWVDLILNMASSSATPADGLELANRNATHGAWDCLPPGLGIGVPVSLIDLAAARQIIAESPEEKFPEFYLDSEAVPFGELITEWFLKPLGAYLTTSGGVAKIVRNRAPLVGAATITIGPDDMLKRKVGTRRYVTDLQASLDTQLISSVVVEMKNDTLVFQNQDLANLLGQSYYQHDDKALKIVVRMRADADGFSEMMKTASLRRLARNRRPPWRVGFKAGFDKNAATVGTLVEITHPELPNLSTGERGWTSIPGEVRERVTRFEPPHFEFLVRAFPGTRVGRIPPSGRIVSATAGNTITLTQNRYTKSDVTAPHATRDAAAFTIGDVVRIRDRSGVDVSATTQTITAINTTLNTITVNGNFGGALTSGTSNAGQIIEFATRANAVSQQHTRHVYFADRATRTVGASTDAPWNFGG